MEWLRQQIPPLGTKHSGHHKQQKFHCLNQMLRKTEELGQRWVTGHSSGQCIEEKLSHSLTWVGFYISWVGSPNPPKTRKKKPFNTYDGSKTKSNNMKAPSRVKFSISAPLISVPTPESGLLCINSCIMQLETEKRDERWYWNQRTST